ncbi:MAG: LysM peptidoglycan-binding domain-containing protein [Chloroflexi bacterium]|nr:LysM peptidoglycan-binding domain-containing protein [Chloroflexota bacterium]
MRNRREMDPEIRDAYESAPGWRERLGEAWSRLTASLGASNHAQAVPMDRYHGSGAPVAPYGTRRVRSRAVQSGQRTTVTAAAIFVLVLVFAVLAWFLIQSFQPRSASNTQPAPAPTAAAKPVGPVAPEASASPLVVLPTAAPGGSARATPSPAATRAPEEPAPNAAPPGPPAPTATSPAQRIYEVRAGDTLGKIAAQYGTTVEAIARENGISDPTKLSIGQKLRIP